MWLVKTMENFAQYKTFHREQPLEAEAITVNKISKKVAVECAIYNRKMISVFLKIIFSKYFIHIIFSFNIWWL